jgi:hypothetical protein
MAWLWYLNAIYWIAVLYVPRKEAIVALIAYLAVGPLIAIMLILQRGITYLTALIHLPWVPFAIYLALRLFTDVLGPTLTLMNAGMYFVWLHAVLWSTMVCLALDALDIARWSRGQRFVFGTPAAAAAGASRMAGARTVELR